MTLKADLVTDALNLLTTEEFAEAITYYPDGDEAVTMNAIIEREPVTPNNFGPTGTKHGRTTYQVYIANHATLGRTSVLKGLDHVEFKKFLSDEDPQMFVITGAVPHDEGMWRLEVQA